MNGYILISRSILNSEIWRKPPLYQKVWLYLLINAQFKPYKDLERGQLFTSIPEIQDACSYYVGYRKEVPTKDQIYKILDWLRTSHESNNESNNESDTNARMITTTKATHGMVVTICNFNVYQCSENYEGNNESNDERVAKATRKQQRKMSGITNINETDIRKENKENKEKNIIPYPLTEFCFGAELENQILIWLKYKTSEKKDSYKEIGFKALLIKIKQNSEKYGEQAIIDLINESISNNWKGIIWDKLLNEKEKEKPKSKLKMVEIPDEFKEVM